MPIRRIIDNGTVTEVTVRIFCRLRHMMRRGRPWRLEMTIRIHAVPEVLHKYVCVQIGIPLDVVAIQAVVDGIRDAIAISIRVRYVSARRDGSAYPQMVSVGYRSVLDGERFWVFVTTSAVLFQQIGKNRIHRAQ